MHTVSGWTSQQAASELNSTSQENISVMACQNGWNYDTSTYQSSIVTEVLFHYFNYSYNRIQKEIMTHLQEFSVECFISFNIRK